MSKSNPFDTHTVDSPPKSPPKKSRPLNQKLSFWMALLIFVVIALVIKQSIHRQGQKDKTKSIPVVVAVARTANVPVYLSALGAVTPTYTVTVRTQINGTLLRVLFTEGQMVRAGDLLAEIDPRPYQAQLLEYEGQLMRDQALLANAKVDLKRYRKLWKQDSVAQQVLATQESLVRQYEGAVQVDQGLINITKVNLIYCRIISPVNGRIGLRLVDPGNFVQTSDTSGIAVVNTLNPITVVFTIPEDRIPNVLPRIYAGDAFSVEAFDRQQTKLLAMGKLLTIDNQIEPSTGTVKLKAEFSNEGNELFPSQFVNIRLLVNTLLNATIIPTAALQYSAQGSFVYVLNNDSTVSVRSVVTGVTNANDTTITSGIQPGQSVVVEGADNLTQGAKVNVAHPKKLASSQQVASISKQRTFL